MREFKKVFPKTVPLLISYLLMGMGFGVLIRSVGRSTLVSVLMSAGISAGAMQFAMVSLFDQPLAVIELIILAVSINLRYLFYTISLLNPLEGEPWWKKILTTHFCSDETFSLYISTGEDGGMATPDDMFAIGLLDFSYWVLGTLLGALLGSVIPINVEGIEFMMTALFITTFIEQWKGTDHHFPAILGMGASLIAVLVFGPGNFILPAMIVILIGNLYYRRKYVN